MRASFEALVELSEEARGEKLRELAARDPRLAEAVEELLAEDSRDSAFLERERGPARAAFAAGQRFGRYELIRPLGQGGMGSVWEARQASPERHVALKLVVHGAWSDAERWRFEHEAQVLATLSHAAIATFFEAGDTDQGGARVSWLAMELVEGAEELLGHAERRGLDQGQRLALFRELCAAVEHGHQHGVIHRDIKPSNALVGADGRLKLIDFGVARAVAGSSATPSLRTQTGALVGTLQFMAPEQLAGRSREVGVGADVYALGVILYQLLCGHPPFDFAGVPLARIPALVLETDPRPPEGLARDLAWILGKALEKDPARRYASVSALAEDLRRFQDHEPIAARPPSTWYSLRKYARRHRMQSALAGALLAGLCVGLFGLASGLRRARAGEAVALREARRSGQALYVLEELFNGIDDTRDGREVKVADMLHEAASAADGLEDPLVEFWVRELRGRSYHRLRLYAEAREELQRAVELATPLALSPSDQERLLSARALLGYAETRLGEPAAGLARMHAVLEEARRDGRAEQELATLLLICKTLAESGAHEELLVRSELALELARKNGNADAERRSLGLHAQALRNSGRPREAAEELRQHWELARRTLGPADPEVHRAASNYATGLLEAGQIDEAEELYAAAIEGLGAALGSEHEELLLLRSNHAYISMARKDYAEAARRFESIVAAYDERGGPASQSYLQALNNLGMAHLEGRDPAAAEPVLARLAELAATVLDEKNVERALFRFNHGACLAALGRVDEGEPLMRSELARLESLMPPDHPNLRLLRSRLEASLRR